MDFKFIFDSRDILIKLGLNQQIAEWLNIAIGVITIILLALLSDIITRKIIITTITRLAKRSKTLWDDIIVEKKVFHRLSHLAPALVIFYSIGYVLGNYETLVQFIQGVIYLYIILVSLLVVDSFINALHEIYQTLPISKDRSIKGYIQIVKIIVYAVAIILIISIIAGVSPAKLLAGLGAIAAVLILVFKDTILGFVASIQLSANDMVRIGDWISMPKYGADGTVIEITLNTVKVQNWDKTISTIPTYNLVSESFSNWRGMEESGGRRIKRHINIDMKSVKFCDEKMLKKFSKIHFLKDYIKKKNEEIQQYNEKLAIDSSQIVNGRRLTNIGVFRKYLEQYLAHHPKIHNDMTFLVRQLQPTEIGIPMEIYVFSNDQKWANYEGIQADIFDHILASVHEFELNVFQNPSGEDFKKIVTN